jgi:hypothetical protein
MRTVQGMSWWRLETAAPTLEAIYDDDPSRTASESTQRASRIGASRELNDGVIAALRNSTLSLNAPVHVDVICHCPLPAASNPTVVGAESSRRFGGAYCHPSASSLPAFARRDL